MIPDEALKAAAKEVYYTSGRYRSMPYAVAIRACESEALKILTAAAPFLRAQALAEVAPLIRDLTDPDDCWFDHHGGCQAHGYLSLEPSEICPHLEAKVWIHTHDTARAVTERGGE